MQDWDSLRIILAIARAGGLSGAARELGVTHATISRQLARAEDRSGSLLFDRMPTGLQPTTAGEAAIATATDVEQHMLDLGRRLAGADGRLSGPLSVTIPPLIIAHVLADDLTEFARTYPEIELSVLGDNAVLNLNRREADIAIRISRDPGDSLWGRKLADQQAAYYAADGFDFAACDTVPLVSFSMWRTPVPKALGENEKDITITATCDDMPSAVALVKAGMGITRMPVFVGETTDGLTRITELAIEPYAPIWMLTHADLKKSGKVRAFMEFMGERVAKRRGMFVV